MNQNSDKNPQTPLRFYGRRKGPTLSDRKKNLLSNLLPNFKIDTPNSKFFVNPQSFFSETKKEIWLEIGFGKGEHLAWQASHNSDVGLIGCEPFVNGVAGLLSHIESQKLENIRIYDDDARHILKCLPEKSIDKIFLLHPDPWPKNRHKDRRFVSPENLLLLANIMKEGAELRIGTDHMGYARWTIFHLHNHPLFDWPAKNSKDWRNPATDWPKTRYQNKALEIGQESVRLIFQRNQKPIHPFGMN